MTRPRLPKAFVKLCMKVTAKRPRTVIDHILKHGFVTTQELRDKYGYNHPPRAVWDVKDNGIPIEMFRVKGSDRRMIGAYRFGNPNSSRYGKVMGRIAFPKGLKKDLVDQQDCRCAIYLEPFDERDLQIDHRIPLEIAGDVVGAALRMEDFMLLCRSANRAKSWSCEHCANRLERKNAAICQACYWAYPENYSHIAMCPVRRLDIMWKGAEVAIYNRLKKKTKELQQDMPAYVKQVIERNLGGDRA